ncbi:hypothetical protein V8C86DRAFT_2873994 [Haematococcus lacustris]
MVLLSILIFLHATGFRAPCCAGSPHAACLALPAVTKLHGSHTILSCSSSLLVVPHAACCVMGRAHATAHADVERDWLLAATQNPAQLLCCLSVAKDGQGLPDDIPKCCAIREVLFTRLFKALLPVAIALAVEQDATAGVCVCVNHDAADASAGSSRCQYGPADGAVFQHKAVQDRRVVQLPRCAL